MLTCGVVLQDGVLAERLVLPRNQNILEACRCGVITTKNHWSKQSRAALLLRNIDLDTHRHCEGHMKVTHTPQGVFFQCIRLNNWILRVREGSSFLKWKQNVCVGFYNLRVDFKVEEPEKLVSLTKTQVTSYCETTKQILKLELNLLPLHWCGARKSFQKIFAVIIHFRINLYLNHTGLAL